MDILIIRHAKAEERSLSGQKDARRPLTEAGRKHMRKAASGLRRLVPTIDVLASSPLVRARQTAEIIAKKYDKIGVTELPLLSPGGSEQELLDWLRDRRKDATVALVGHEPDLGWFASWLVCGKKLPFAPLRKGAAGLIHFTATPVAGHGMLEWWLTPVQLRQLG